jgi:hypothetical protein
MSQQMSTAAGPRCALVAVRSWVRQGQQTATPDPAGDACVEGTLSAVTGSTSSAGVVKELAVVTAGDRHELAHAFVVPGNTFAVPVAVTAPTPAEVCVVESASARDRRFAELDVSSGGGSEQFSRCRRIPDLQPDAVAQVPTDGLNDLVPPQGTS